MEFKTASFAARTPQKRPETKYRDDAEDVWVWE
jgi:hypothetical protein